MAGADSDMCLSGRGGERARRTPPPRREQGQEGHWRRGRMAGKHGRIGERGRPEELLWDYVRCGRRGGAAGAGVAHVAPSITPPTLTSLPATPPDAPPPRRHLPVPKFYLPSSHFSFLTYLLPSPLLFHLPSRRSLLPSFTFTFLPSLTPPPSLPCKTQRHAATATSLAAAPSPQPNPTPPRAHCPPPMHS